MDHKRKLLPSSERKQLLNKYYKRTRHGNDSLLFDISKPSRSQSPSSIVDDSVSIIHAVSPSTSFESTLLDTNIEQALSVDQCISSSEMSEDSVLQDASVSITEDPIQNVNFETVLENQNDDDHIEVNSKLTEWALKHNITHSAITDLLQILKPKFPTLPLNARTVPSFNSTRSTSDDDLTLRQLADNFANFGKECMRKQNLLTRRSMLAEILTEVKTLKESIKALDISKRLESTSSQETLYDKLSLPAKNIEEIKEIEDYLTIPENFPKVVEEMSKVGGNSPFDFIKRVSLQLMIYKVAACYTWHGTKEKLPFKNTRMCQMIMRASTAIGTQKQVEEALQKFFRRAKERCASENKTTT